MDEWKPINYKGSIYHDPRQELEARARTAQSSHDDWVAVPVKLALAVVNLHECGAKTILKGDEDGPLPTPLLIFCRKPKGHAYEHYNGYVHWRDE